MLIPVNLGGVLKSLKQALTGRKTPFGRTPKVVGRTAAPALYVLAEYGLLGWWLVGATTDVMHGHYAHLAFALTNAGFLAYAIYRYIGWRNSVEDLLNGIALASGLVNGAGSHHSYAHFSRSRIARPITQSLSLSDRKESSSVKWVMRWRQGTRVKEVLVRSVPQ